MQVAVDFNNYSFLIQQTFKLRKELKSSSSALEEVNFLLSQIHNLSKDMKKYKEPMPEFISKRVKELAKIVEQIKRAKEASQEALDPQDIARYKEMIENARKNAEESVNKQPAAASIFVGSMVIE